MEVTLEEMLRAREDRVRRQEAMLRRYGGPLISFSMNMPGPVKDSPLLRRAFRAGRAQLEAGLRAWSLPVLAQEERLASTGCEGLYAAAGPAEKVKELCVSIEEGSPLGRLWDMDVLSPGGSRLAREAVGGRPRGCMVCGKAGRGCASRRLHAVSELQEAARRILTSHFAAADRDRAAALATQALLEEVCVTPKPGLVDCANTGSHRDMDLFTFLRSAAALTPYWAR